MLESPQMDPPDEPHISGDGPSRIWEGDGGRGGGGEVGGADRPPNTGDDSPLPAHHPSSQLRSWEEIRTSPNESALGRPKFLVQATSASLFEGMKRDKAEGRDDCGWWMMEHERDVFFTALLSVV